MGVQSDVSNGADLDRLYAAVKEKKGHLDILFANAGVSDSINRKQFEYLQAMTQIQEDLLGACNGLIKNQVDLIEEYSKKGIVTREQTMPIVEMINEYIEGYLAYLSLEYDLV